MGFAARSMQRPLEQPAQRVEQRKLYLYPDQLHPALASSPDLSQAIRLGMLVHGPGATEMTYRSWHHEDSNSAVFACLRYICTAASEAPATVWREVEPGKRDPLPEHPYQALLNKPLPALDGTGRSNLTAKELEYYKQWCKHVNGNAYQRKIRAGGPTGNVVQLWPISPLRIVPVTTQEDAARGIFISYYAYKYDPAKDPERIPASDIVHYRLGLDDKDHRLGRSPLAAVYREIMGDDEAFKWQTMLLGNGGAASLVVEVPPESNMTVDQAEDLKVRITERFTGANRGAVGVLMDGAKLTQYGFSPEQMDMASLHRVPEERISAVLGAAAVIVGLGAGLEHSIYNNYHEAREAFTEDTLLPLYTDDADTLNSQLTPDFTSDPNVIMAYDTSKMRSLQEDQNAKYVRVVNAWDKWLFTRNEARSELGFPALPDGDVYKSELTPAPAPFGQVTEVDPEKDEDKPDDEKPKLPPGKKARQLVQIGDLEQMPEILQALVDLAEPVTERELERHFDRQRKTVRRRLIAGG